MSVLLPIGEFSRMTYLTVKALRHYHDVGLLEPADIDPANGYRLYSTDQVGTALMISRFRDLDMPLDEVRAVFDADDVDERNEIILRHLAHMEERFDRTRETVASLRALLESPARPIDVQFRSVPASRWIAIAEVILGADCEAWLNDAYAELHGAIASDERPTGPDGALYYDEFFTAAEGEVVAYVPVGSARPRSGRVHDIELPAGRIAVAVHEGPFAGIDRTYGALGTFVAERGLGAPGPVRESYVVVDLDDPARQRTEVCWPIIDDDS